MPTDRIPRLRAGELARPTSMAKAQLVAQKRLRIETTFHRRIAALGVFIATHGQGCARTRMRLWYPG